MTDDTRELQNGYRRRDGCADFLVDSAVEKKMMERSASVPLQRGALHAAPDLEPVL